MTKRFKLKCRTHPAGEVVIRVDDADAYHLRSVVWTASINNNGALMVLRARPGGSNGTDSLQRMLMDCPSHRVVRFKDGDRSNFCRSNLLVADDFKDRPGVISKGERKAQERRKREAVSHE